MNQESLLKRIREIEREMLSIRTEIAPQKNRRRRILAKSGCQIQIAPGGNP